MPPEVDITSGVKTPCSISLTLWPCAHLRVFCTVESLLIRCYRVIWVKDPDIKESVLSSSPCRSLLRVYPILHHHLHSLRPGEGQIGVGGGVLWACGANFSEQVSCRVSDLVVAYGWVSHAAGHCMVSLECFT